MLKSTLNLRRRVLFLRHWNATCIGTDKERPYHRSDLLNANMFSIKNLSKVTSCTPYSDPSPVPVCATTVLYTGLTDGGYVVLILRASATAQGCCDDRHFPCSAAPGEDRPHVSLGESSLNSGTCFLGFPGFGRKILYSDDG